jgi:hypothetical protein
MSNCYVVAYGVDNSHTTELKTFKLYSEAMKAYNGLDRETYKAAYIAKLVYNAKGFVSDRVCKQYYNEFGTDHFAWLKSLELS